MQHDLSARQLSVRLGGNTVLDQVDFTAAAGHLTAIIGPNGSGKTTLLRALTGEVAFSGSVVMNDVDVTRANPAELAALRAVLPQSIALAFPFTVLEVVRLGLQARRSGAGTLAADLPHEALAKVGLAGFEGRFYQQLSGGEQQRVQLARILVQIWEPSLEDQPRWLLLDEPVSSLDIRHQLSIMQLARSYARAGGGVIAVMHDLNLTAMFADRVYLMKDGEIAASGTSGEVICDQLLEGVFECALKVGATPPASTPFVLPHSVDAV